MLALSLQGVNSMITIVYSVQYSNCQLGMDNEFLLQPLINTKTSKEVFLLPGNDTNDWNVDDSQSKYRFE